MHEETLNVQTRKFLKKVGINAQREIEKAVHAAIADGRLHGDERLQAAMRLSIGALDLEVVIEDEIALE